MFPQLFNYITLMKHSTRRSQWLYYDYKMLLSIQQESQVHTYYSSHNRMGWLRRFFHFQFFIFQYIYKKIGMNCNWPQPGGALATYFMKIAPPWLRSYEIHYLNIYRQSKRFSKPFRLIIVVKYSTRWSNISRMTAEYSRQLLLLA